MLFRIPIFIYLFFFFASWGVENWKKNDKNLVRISNIFILSLGLLYAIWYTFTFSNGIYMMNIYFSDQVYSGFVTTYSWTRSFCVTAILAMFYIFFDRDLAKDFKYLLVIFGAIFSMPFVGGNSGMELLLTVYLTFYTIIYCRTTQDQKSVHRTISSSVLTYILISFGFEYKELQWLCLLGLAVHLNFPPFANRIYRIKTNALNSQVMLLPISLLFGLGFMLYIAESGIITANIKHILTGISLVMILYGAFYAFFEQSTRKTVIYFAIFIAGFILNLFCVDEVNSAVLNSINKIAGVGIFSYISLLIALKLTPIKDNFQDIECNFATKAIITLAIVSLSISPFVSCIYSRNYIIGNMNLVNQAIQITVAIMVFYFLVKIAQIKQSSGVIPREYGIINEYLPLAYIFFGVVVSIFDSLGIGIFGIYPQMAYNYSIFSNIVLSFIGSLLSFMVVRSVMDFSLKHVSHNALDLFFIRCVNSIIAIYDMSILYAHWAITTILESIKHDLGNVFARVVHKNQGKKVKSHPVLHLIIILSLCIAVKIFS